MKKLLPLFLGLWLLLLARAVTADVAFSSTIIKFTADKNAVRLDDAEAQQASVTLSWEVALYDGEQRVALETYGYNGWTPILPTQDRTPLVSDSITLPIGAPLNFIPPTYRLSVQDTDGHIVDERTVVIQYDVSDLKPLIENFTIDPQTLDAGALEKGEARIGVTWRVSSRLPTANLTFEQFFEDSSAVNIELPRPNLWIDSSGSGVVVPIAPRGEDSVHLRLRVVDLMTHEVYDEEVLEIPMTAAVSAAPENNPTEVVTRCGLSPLAVPAAGKPGDGCNIYVDPDTGVQTVISAFEISPQPAKPGHTVTLDWNIIGAPIAILEIYDRLQSPITPENGERFTPPLEVFIPLPPHGSQTVTIPSNGARFILWAADDTPQTPTSTVTSMIRRIAYAIIDVGADGSVVSGQPCMPTFRFSDTDQGNCLLPVQQVKIDAAFQSFANGFMIWRADLDQIFVFVNGGSMSLFELPAYENLPDNPVTDTPPDGSFKPISRFGRVWGNHPEVRDSLGWATSPEQAYQSTLQFTRYPVVTTYFYLTLPGGDVVQIHGARRWNFEVSYSLE